MKIELHLPYPPTVNSYWSSRRGQSSRFLSDYAKLFHQHAAHAWLEAGQPTIHDARVKVSVALYPPDTRRRDIDNTMKAVGDALEKCGLLQDDEQIDEWHIRRCERVEDGACIVIVEAMSK